MAALAQEGSEPAFSELVDRYASLVYKIALGITGSQPEAEEIVQETFIKMFNNLADYAPEKGKLKTWLLTIARNQSLNVLKSLKRKAARIVTEPARDEEQGRSDEDRFGSNDTTAESLLERKQKMAGVEEAMSKLPKRQRAALTLKAVENLSYAEIGSIMGVSESSVESLIFRARKRLVELLAENT